MDNEMICQSCAMPIDKQEDRGTEKDAQKSSLYCRYCYQNGAFTNPRISEKKMETVMRKLMTLMHVPEENQSKAIKMLPYLKRWQTKKRKSSHVA